MSADSLVTSWIAVSLETSTDAGMDRLHLDSVKRSNAISGTTKTLECQQQWRHGVSIGSPPRPPRTDAPWGDGPRIRCAYSPRQCDSLRSSAVSPGIPRNPDRRWPGLSGISVLLPEWRRQKHSADLDSAHVPCVATSVIVIGQRCANLVTAADIEARAQ